MVRKSAVFIVWENVRTAGQDKRMDRISNVFLTADYADEADKTDFNRLFISDPS